VEEISPTTSTSSPTRRRGGHPARQEAGEGGWGASPEGSLGDEGAQEKLNQKLPARRLRTPKPDAGRVDAGGAPDAGMASATTAAVDGGLAAAEGGEAPPRPPRRTERLALRRARRGGRGAEAADLPLRRVADLLALARSAGCTEPADFALAKPDLEDYIA